MIQDRKFDTEQVNEHKYNHYYYVRLYYTQFMYVYNERFARIACRTRDLIFEVFFNETLLSHKMSFNWNTIKT